MSEKTDPTGNVVSISDAQKNAQFAKVIANTLDKSLENVDAINLQRLGIARVHALSQKPSSSRKWIALSVAASLAAVLVVPYAWHQHNIAGDDELELFSQEILPDAQEMDDVDMLIALEDGDA